jgi:uracil-DNA glycosylase
MTVKNAVVLALGGVAHRAVISALGLRQVDHPFGHGVIHQLDQPSGQLTLVDSYHCSRYNTQTGRLTEDMFLEVVRQVRDIANP